MMFDVSKADDMFGYIMTNPQTGQIAEVGTLCEITNRELLEDGRQFIALKGVGRFKVNSILKTLPYIAAEIQEIKSDEIVANEQETEALEKDVYNYLKFYLRIMKKLDNTKDLVVSQQVKALRPIGATLSQPFNNIRRSKFSFAIANMIQMQSPTEAQILLQTVDVDKRLRFERHILRQASDLIASKFVSSGLITQEVRDQLRIQSFSSEDDTDVLPPEFVDQREKDETDEWDLSSSMN
jgi:ATP-dependent Lon protease